MPSTVHNIFRYPVKSTLGESLKSTVLTQKGIPGDRGWAIREENIGVHRGAKRFPELMHVSSRYVQNPTANAPKPPVVLKFPDGTSLDTRSGDVDSELTKRLKKKVSIWPILPNAVRNKPSNADLVDAFQRPHETIARQDLYETVPGHHFDAFPLLIMTTNSLNSITKLLPQSKIDWRRFRPNLIIANSGPGDFPEFDWIGKELIFGNILVKVHMACPRCIMTTLPVDNLPADDEVLNTLRTHTDSNLGVYASVVSSSEDVISIGDTVVISD